jgi:hypothetical protein
VTSVIKPKTLEIRAYAIYSQRVKVTVFKRKGQVA